MLLAVWLIPTDTALALLGAVLVLFGAPFLIYLLLRLVTAALVRGSMMREAGKVLEASAASEVPAASPGPPPESALRFWELDETADLRLTPGQHAHVKQAFETAWRLGSSCAGASWSLSQVSLSPAQAGHFSSRPPAG
jgi:hypothetical protein